MTGFISKTAQLTANVPHLKDRKGRSFSMIHGICSTYTCKKTHSTNHGTSPVLSEPCPPLVLFVWSVSQWLLRSFPKHLGCTKEILWNPMSSAQGKNIGNPVHTRALYAQDNPPSAAWSVTSCPAMKGEVRKGS